MKNLHTIKSLALGLMLATVALSCSKESDDSSSNNTIDNNLAMNTWTVKAGTAEPTTYTATLQEEHTSNGMKSYFFMDENSGSPAVHIWVQFGGDAAPASGTYTLVKVESGKIPGANQATITAGGFSGYFSYEDSGKIKVTNEGGVVTLVGTDIKTRLFEGSTQYTVSFKLKK